MILYYTILCYIHTEPLYRLLLLFLVFAAASQTMEASAPLVQWFSLDPDTGGIKATDKQLACSDVTTVAFG